MSTEATPPKKKSRPFERGRQMSVYTTEDTVSIADGIAQSTGLTRHAVVVIALRSGLGSIGHMSQAELWAMLPRHVKSRLRKLGHEPADRYALRERLKRRKIADAYKADG